MAIPIKYRKDPEPMISSYDFLDIITGTAYATYYLLDVNTGTDTADYFLTNTTIHGNLGYSKITTGSFDLDFDLEIQKPLILDGNAFVSFPVAYYAATPVDFTIDWTVNIYRVVAGVETLLGTSKVSIDETSVSTTAKLNRRTMRIDIAKIKILAGDIIRVNIISDAVPGSGTPQMWLGIDPKNRSTFGTSPNIDWSTPGSQSLFLMPQRVDL